MENNENIKEADLEKRNIYLEYALFLVLGFLLGIVIKTEAGKRITIGFNDYMVDTKKEIYSINAIQKNLAKEKEQPAEEEQIQEESEELQSAPEDQQEQEEGGAVPSSEEGTTEGASTSR